MKLLRYWGKSRYYMRTILTGSRARTCVYGRRDWPSYSYWMVPGGAHENE